MYPHSDRFAAALRASHTRIATAVHRNLITGVLTPLPIEDGTVTDDATSNVRRSLNLTLPATEALYDVLDTYGGEISIRQGIRFTDDTDELLPMGVFIVNQDQIGYSPSGQIQLTCPDRWSKVSSNRFGLNRASVPSNMAWQEIKRLVEGAWPGGTYGFPGWAHVDTSATTQVGSLIWDDGDREAAILQLCATNGVEVFFDRNGLGVLQPVPYLSTSSPSVWLVDASATGVMIDANRSRDITTVRNALIITTSATDVTFPPVEVKNTTSGDPLAVDGPLGYVPEEWSAPTFRNSTQARAAGLTRLRRNLGVAKQLSLTAVGNPALDSEDVITALLPKVDPNTARPSEVHMLDSLTHPLVPSGTQELATRSTRPTTDGS